ncbi:VWA domain-containing protein [Acinetobacter indicus]|jgi:uncharacterized protein with von Willebrand factor type A (vWA) domain|uniref:VWA domain-containing protein n=1 Tax=Acinetobacter indicus TaxID=756892 RepID=UPI0032145D09
MSRLDLQQHQRQHTALEQLTGQLYQELADSSLKHWLDDQKVSQHLDDKVRAWAYQAKSSLDQQHPYREVQQQLEHWLAQPSINSAEFQQMQVQYQDFQAQLGLPDLSPFWTQSATFSAGQRELQAQLLTEKWQRKLTEAIAHWEFEQLALQRDAFLDEIRDFLSQMQRLAKYKDATGIETGIFIDYSRGQLQPQDIQQFEQWASYLQDDRELQALCQKIGSAQPAHYPRQAVQQHRPEQELELLEQHWHEEITGIQLAQDLNLALPSELALLADPDLALLFDLKYLESNLMSFNLQGQHSSRVIQDQTARHKRLGQKGPMILCLDTSGSMHGQPELIAKAMSLYLAIQAMKAKRPMYLINFSTQLTSLNLLEGYSLDDLIHFLSQSFHGGTDVIPAIEHALSMLAQSNFHNADVLVVSDFIMEQLPTELMAQVEQQKQQGTGFYAVAIGNFRFEHLNQGLFDHQWIYQSKERKVRYLPSNRSDRVSK